MADEKLAYENISQAIHQAHSRQPITATDTSILANTPVGASSSGNPSSSNSVAHSQDTIQPVLTADSNASSSEFSGTAVKKTGTRSTFCPTNGRSTTKLTEADFDDPEKDKPQPTGWLAKLGFQKCAHFGDRLEKEGDPQTQSYY
ncbi:hypothetical protein BGW38_004337 [Lunasporangiospora selenospora]|uniref:Uncharacterized protein n=1 Tax=Lunasporangiospora selenospora TaxID=979761 RepID=A0A9P6FPE4_9FUNG|nr:hypothetical protein BGW38_004337 [Lunasporangiospora selenospora]